MKKWRDKVKTEESKDYLYLTQTGKPFTKNYLRKVLYEKVVPNFPEFHPYICRDWCAIARLIETKIQSGSFDIFDVYDWFQHSGISVTENYIQDTKRYYSIHKKSWVKTVLKSPKN